ncbi:hypothetical protein KAU11_10925 [Candidatus Babeliales bacterium]|nr:hypothetical protein [Candidatus Babeliales bacterium]
MKNNIFKHSYDSVILSYNVLKRLRSGKINLLEERIRSQKINYLAQQFGVVPVYPYNLYIRGPYSPDLAYDLYQIKNNDIETEIVNFVPDELEKRFIKLKTFIKGKSNRELEVITTLHWLIKIADFSNKEATEKLVELKNASNDEINYAFSSIKTI